MNPLKFVQCTHERASKWTIYDTDLHEHTRRPLPWLITYHHRVRPMCHSSQMTLRSRHADKQFPPMVALWRLKPPQSPHKNVGQWDGYILGYIFLNILRCCLSLISLRLILSVLKHFLALRNPAAYQFALTSQPKTHWSFFSPLLREHHKQLLNEVLWYPELV